MVYTMQISYLEIYNETGYDLLDARNEASRLEDLPSVSLLISYQTVLFFCQCHPNTEYSIHFSSPRHLWVNVSCTPEFLRACGEKWGI